MSSLLMAITSRAFTTTTGFWSDVYELIKPKLTSILNLGIFPSQNGFSSEGFY